MPPKKKQKVADGPSWEYQDGTAWVPYDPKDGATLERLYQANPATTATTSTLTFNKGFKTKYEFDFPGMTQRNTESGTTKPIRRVVPAADPAPAAAATSASGDAKDYQWSWQDDTGLFAAFYDEDNEFLEKAYQKDPTAAGFKTTALSFNTEHKTPYVFNFKKMEQLNTESNTVRRIQRGAKAKAWDMKDYGTKSAAESSQATTAIRAADPSVLDFPSHWTPRTGDVDLVAVDLKSDEAGGALKAFRASIKRKVVIHSLTRIQNYAIWPFYALTRKAMADRYSGDPNEKLLFHGARVRANMDAITNFGFDMRVASTGLYGVGIYFAVNATYSDHGYVLQNPDKSKEMFLCRVTCGKHVPGKSDLRRPPPKDATVPNGELYDSVTDSQTVHVMHVVFNNAQAYPEYIVRYT